MAKTKVLNVRIENESLIFLKEYAAENEMNLSQALIAIIKRGLNSRAPVAYNAHAAIQRAIKKGVMTRPKKCEECGAVGKKIEAAHFDYKDKFNVRWLCVSCHRKWDRLDPKGCYPGISGKKRNKENREKRKKDEETKYKKLFNLRITENNFNNLESFAEQNDLKLSEAGRFFLEKVPSENKASH